MQFEWIHVQLNGGGGGGGGGNDGGADCEHIVGR